MADRACDVAVIGAGQAGLGISHGLAARGIDHVVLERGRIGNAWVRDRWDSFCLVTPNWSIMLPGAPCARTVAAGAPEGGPDGFLPRDGLVRLLRDWAAGFGAPVREGVEVRSVTGEGGRFLLDTGSGPLTARRVVVATATYQRPRRPGFAAALPPDIQGITAAQYRSPATVPPGGVLVVGSGQSGCQIAEELNAAGRPVWLSVSRVGRLPRRYRGRDCIAWQRDMGLLDRRPGALAHPSDRFRPDPHVSGLRGGHTLSLHTLRASGVTLVGRAMGIDGGTVLLAPDLAANVAFSDSYAAEFRRSVDRHLCATGGEAPEPTGDELTGEPPQAAPPRHDSSALDLRELGIGSVIWCTGFDFDFSWVRFPVLDGTGYPETVDGATAVPGLYFMGLNWMRKRKSGILYGIAEDSAVLAARIEADWRTAF